MRILILTLLMLSHATPALASDGVLEINQTCAVQTGCFAGDAAGFPVMISTPGTSYVLTSRLIVPDENTNGIVVRASVTVDLNGFEIVRSGCEDASLDCKPASGTGSGIKVFSSANTGVSVKNGSITGMGAYGVELGDQAEVTNLRVRWNRLGGIRAVNASTISDNTAYANGGDGIFAGNGST